MSYCGAWKLASENMKKYHDEEWGVPVHDDQKQFEHLMLEALQCGLSWQTILNKREVFRSCLDDFDFDKVALYDEKDVARILNTSQMIRCERKIRSIISNARCFQKIREECRSFSNYIWSYSDGRTILYENHAEGYVPASNGLSKMIADDLKKRGFKYLGEVTVYAHLQSCGIINDHSFDCECHKKIIDKYPTVTRERFLEKNVNYYQRNK